MPGVLGIEAQHVLPKVIELLAALTEGIHLAEKEVQQGVVAVETVKIEYAIILIMVLLHIAGSDEIRAESQLVLAARQVHVVGSLKTGDVENPQSAGAATHGESAVIDGNLQEVTGALIDVFDT